LRKKVGDYDTPGAGPERCKAESSKGQRTIVYMTPEPQTYYMTFYFAMYDASRGVNHPWR
jgi:hypothetical protein